ncbi:hypothetical protein MP228_011523 [Amoeboaphelidium protococcarum]|nr:hypothetical protein MP228_011523 [Amoeboaphelidium protococcarum]
MNIQFFDDYKIWDDIQPIIRNALPVRNIEWKSQIKGLDKVTLNCVNFNFIQCSGATSGLIQQGSSSSMQSVSSPLPSIVPSTPISSAGGNVSANSVSIQSPPLVYLLVIKCNDEAELKQLKIKCRQLQDSNRRFLLLTFNSSSSIVDKLKSEFKSRNVVSLDQDGVEEVISRLTDAALQAASLKINQLSEDVKRLDQSRSLPGFNYLNFFLVKEQLASVYESLSLYNESLLLYQELDHLFIQTMDSTLVQITDSSQSQQLITWSANVGGGDHTDDSSSIFAFDKKSYHDLIRSNSISIFDFWSYLFARQIYLILRHNEQKDSSKIQYNLLIEILLRSKLFIIHLSRRLRRHQDNLRPYFVESWKYSAYHDVLNLISNLIEQGYNTFGGVGNSTGEIKVDGSPAEVKRFKELKVECLLDIKSILDVIGWSVWKIGSISVSVSQSTERQSTADYKNLSNEIIKQCLSSFDQFYDTFMTVCQQCVEYTQQCGMHGANKVVRIHISLAQYHKGLYKESADSIMECLQLVAEAYQQQTVLSKSLNNKQFIQSLTMMDINALDCLFSCLVQLQREYDAMSVLLMLLSRRDLLKDSDLKLYCQKFNEFALKLPADNMIECNLDLLFSAALITNIDVSGQAENQILDCGKTLCISIESQLPQFKVDEISVVAYSKVNSQIMYHSDNSPDGIVLSPGLNRVYLKCNQLVPSGTYCISQIVISIGQCVKLVKMMVLPDEPKRLVNIRHSMKDLHLLGYPEYRGDDCFDVVIHLDSNLCELPDGFDLQLQSDSAVEFTKAYINVGTDGQGTAELLFQEGRKLSVKQQIQRDTKVVIRCPVTVPEFGFDILTMLLSAGGISIKHQEIMDFRKPVEVTVTRKMLYKDQVLVNVQVKSLTEHPMFFRNLTVDFDNWKSVDRRNSVSDITLFSHQIHSNQFIVTTENGLKCETQVSFTCVHIEDVIVCSLFDMVTSAINKMSPQLLQYGRFLTLYVISGILTGREVFDRKVCNQAALFRRLALSHPAPYHPFRLAHFLKQNDNSPTSYQLLKNAMYRQLRAPSFEYKVMQKHLTQAYHSGVPSSVLIDQLLSCLKFIYQSASSEKGLKVCFDGTEDSQSKMSFRVPLSLPPYRVQYRWDFGDQMFTSQQLAPVKIAIKCLQTSQGGKDAQKQPDIKLQYEVIQNPQRWVIVGKTKGQFSMKSHGIDHILCTLQLMSTVFGKILLPEILITVDSSSNPADTDAADIVELEYQNKNDQVIVQPNSKLTQIHDISLHDSKGN